MNKRLTLTLRIDERDALWTLAEREFREPHAQAELIIRQELERRGLLSTDPKQNQAQEVKAQLPY
jgi:hypothetical protein